MAEEIKGIVKPPYEMPAEKLERAERTGGGQPAADGSNVHMDLLRPRRLRFSIRVHSRSGTEFRPFRLPDHYIRFSIRAHFGGSDVSDIWVPFYLYRLEVVCPRLARALDRNVPLRCGCRPYPRVDRRRQIALSSRISSKCRHADGACCKCRIEFADLWVSGLLPGNGAGLQGDALGLELACQTDRHAQVTILR